MVETSRGIASSVVDHICPVESGKPIEQLSREARPAKCLATLPDLVHDEFIVPSLFSKTHWVKRLLTNAEILSTLDSPVQITKSVNDKRLDTNFSQNKFMVQNLIPLKTIQEASRILFGFSISREERHIIPIYDINRLATEAVGMQDIYFEIDQAKVAKADDSKIDTTLWDEQASHCSMMDGVDDFKFKVVNTDHRHLKEEK